MRCPQCGCNMEKTNNCPYCDISKEQVYFASNKKAKECLKKGLKDQVCYSSIKPRDVDKVKMLLLTFFLGFFGAGNFYVGKRGKGIFSCLSFVFAFVVMLIKIILQQAYATSIEAVNIVSDLLVACAAITVIIWVSDLFSLILNIYKYPVVIPERETLEKEVDLNAR